MNSRLYTNVILSFLVVLVSVFILLQLIPAPEASESSNTMLLTSMLDKVSAQSTNKNLKHYAWMFYNPKKQSNFDEQFIKYYQEGYTPVMMSATSDDFLIIFSKL